MFYTLERERHDGVLDNDGGSIVGASSSAQTDGELLLTLRFNSQPLKIPLSEKEAVSLLLRVKPTADMPRPGASKSKPKAKKKISKAT